MEALNLAGECDFVGGLLVQAERNLRIARGPIDLKSRQRLLRYLRRLGQRPQRLLDLLQHLVVLGHAGGAEQHQGAGFWHNMQQLQLTTFDQCAFTCAGDLPA